MAEIPGGDWQSPATKAFYERLLLDARTQGHKHGQQLARQRRQHGGDDAGDSGVQRTLRGLLILVRHLLWLQLGLLLLLIILLG